MRPTAFGGGTNSLFMVKVLNFAPRELNFTECASCVQGCATDVKFIVCVCAFFSLSNLRFVRAASMEWPRLGGLTPERSKCHFELAR